MFPFGISQATAIRVSQSMVAGSIQQAKYVGYVGLALVVSIAIITAILFITVATTIVHLFNRGQSPYDMEELIKLSTHFLKIMALFQFFDAMQIIMNCTITKNI